MLTIERVLLGLILLMQAAILALRVHDRGRAAGPAAGLEESVPADPAAVAAVEQDPPPATGLSRPRQHGSIRLPAFPPLLSADRAFLEMAREMDAVLQRAFSVHGPFSDLRNFDRGWERIPASPAIDMRERDNSYVVVITLPEALRTDVEVLLEGQLLTVAAPAGKASRPLAGRQSAFRHRILLPGPPGDASQCEACVTNGLLRIMIPKSRSPDPHARRLRIM